MIKKEAELLKYTDIRTAIQLMWNVKTKVIQVTVGTTGTIPKSFRKYVSNVPENHEIKKLKKTAILGTAYILGEVRTNVKIQNINMGSNIICTVNCNYRIALGRSRWLHGQRSRSAADRLLGLRFRIPPGKLIFFVNVVCCADRGRCDEPISRPRESYRVRVCQWMRSGATITFYTWSE